MLYQTATIARNFLTFTATHEEMYGSSFQRGVICLHMQPLESAPSETVWMSKVIMLYQTVTVSSL
jgi:hypothetical protein